MAFVENFTASQSSGTPSVVTLTDTSTGSDGAIVSRLITILQADGTETEYAWPLADTSIDLDILTEDAALQITVEWLNVGGTVLYTDEQTFNFTAYNETFYYGLTVQEVPITNPSVAMSTDYYKNKMALRVFIDSANQAVSFASDIYSAQACDDAATFMNVNSNDFF